MKQATGNERKKMNSSVRSLKTRVELSDDRIAYLAPSVFASQPVAGVSERYTFLPTSQILARMRSEGWAPVEARQQTVRVENRIGFQKHMLRFQRTELIAKAGEFTPELVLTNSHDRSVSGRSKPASSGRIKTN